MQSALRNASKEARESTPEAEATPCRRLIAECGAAAELESGGESEILRVRDPEGAILFEYDAKAGRGTLRMPKGDLRLEALQGNIELLSGGSVHCVAAGDVSLMSATTASVSVTHAGKTAGMRVDRGRVALGGEEIAATAKRAEVRLDRARVVAEAVTAVVARADLSYGELSVRAETLLETAGNVFRRVKELHELSAGRLRTLVEGAMQMQAESVVMRAREDVHIDGDHINLG